MAYCESNPCSLPERHERHRLIDGPFVVGDICAVDASTSHPIHNTFAGPGGSGLSISAVGSARSSLTRLTNVHHELLPRRPALICPAQVRTRSNRPWICLMGTFGGDSIDELPAVLRHWLVPVHPTLSDKPQHLHTSPEWEVRTSQWICANPYQYPRQYGRICDRWQSAGTHYRVSHQAMLAFVRLCNKKRYEWSLLDDDVKEAWAEEYRVYFCLVDLSSFQLQLKFGAV
jgi:hypothetical protein